MTSCLYNAVLNIVTTLAYLQEAHSLKRHNFFIYDPWHEQQATDMPEKLQTAQEVNKPKGLSKESAC